MATGRVRPMTGIKSPGDGRNKKYGEGGTLKRTTKTPKNGKRPN